MRLILFSVHLKCVVLVAFTAVFPNRKELHIVWFIAVGIFLCRHAICYQCFQ